MEEPYWHVEWRKVDPERPSEYEARAGVYQDHASMAAFTRALLDDPTVDCIHVRKYPEHAPMDIGVDVTRVKRVLRTEVEHMVDSVVGKLSSNYGGLGL